MKVGDVTWVAEVDEDDKVRFVRRVVTRVGKVRVVTEGLSGGRITHRLLVADRWMPAIDFTARKALDSLMDEVSADLRSAHAKVKRAEVVIRSCEQSKMVANQLDDKGAAARKAWKTRRLKSVAAMPDFAVEEDT